MSGFFLHINCGGGGGSAAGKSRQPEAAQLRRLDPRRHPRRARWQSSAHPCLPLRAPRQGPRRNAGFSRGRKERELRERGEKHRSSRSCCEVRPWPGWELSALAPPAGALCLPRPLGPRPPAGSAPEGRDEARQRGLLRAAYVVGRSLPPASCLRPRPGPRPPLFRPLPPPRRWANQPQPQAVLWPRPPPPSVRLFCPRLEYFPLASTSAG